MPSHTDNREADSDDENADSVAEPTDTDHPAGAEQAAHNTADESPG